MFVEVRKTWKQERVFFFLGDDGALSSLPVAWTDAADPDVFVAVSAGRSAFRVEDLLALAEIADGLRRSCAGGPTVRRTLPVM